MVQDGMVAAEELLGIGLYSPSEAALYARVRPQLVSSWIYGTKATNPVIDPQLGALDDKIVTFLDFIQTLAIRRMRTERGISLQRIREGYQRAREMFGVEYPLADQTTRIGLFGPPNNPKRQEVFICLRKETEAEVLQFFQLTGKGRKNQLIGEVVMTYARYLEFSTETGLACRFTAFQNEYGAITMDPEVRFGEPFIEKCGYTAHTLFNAYQTERSLKRAALIYGVDERYIQLAIDYFDYLSPVAAA